MDVFRNPGVDGLASGDLGGGGGADLGGLLAPLAPGSWLPAQSDGSSLGAMPATLNQRYVDLYQKLGKAGAASAPAGPFRTPFSTSPSARRSLSMSRLR